MPDRWHLADIWGWWLHDDDGCDGWWEVNTTTSQETGHLSQSCHEYHARLAVSASDGLTPDIIKVYSTVCTTLIGCVIWLLAGDWSGAYLVVHCDWTGFCCWFWYTGFGFGWDCLASNHDIAKLHSYLLHNINTVVSCTLTQPPIGGKGFGWPLLLFHSFMLSNVIIGRIITIMFRKVFIICCIDWPATFIEVICAILQYQNMNKL